MTIIIVEDDPDILSMYKDQWVSLLAEAAPLVKMKFFADAIHAAMAIDDDVFILATDGSIPSRPGLKSSEGSSQSLLAVATEAGVPNRIIASSNPALTDKYMVKGLATEGCDKTNLINRIAEILETEMA